MSSAPHKDMEEIIKNDAETAEYNFKKKVIEQDSVRNKYDIVQEKNAELKALEALDLDHEDRSVIQKIADETKDYLLKAKNAKVFLNNDFKGKVPLFPRNIILAAAETGVGKSTICANLAKRAIMQNQRVLILSNEESEGDIYNRITCLIKGWAYVDHGSFTDEQRETFHKMTFLLSERVTVVGNNRGDLDNLTTTIEGVKRVLDSVVEKDSKFDLIIIDYYQNIDRSIAVPSMDIWQAQYRFCKYIDQYKNRSNAAIVLLAQLKSSGDKTLSFKEAIEGRKTIMNVSSCVLRVTKEADKRRTGFEIMKSRFNASLGQTIYVGFDRGEYVDYTPEFKHKADMEALERSLRTLPGKSSSTSDED